MAGPSISTKVLRILAALSCLSVVDCARVASFKTVTVNQNSNNTEVSLSIGQQLEIVLPENPTTGFLWEMTADGAPPCAPRGSDFEAPSGGPGKGGIRHWRFEAVQTGSAPIELVYRRSFEKDKAPAQVFRITVNVGK